MPLELFCEGGAVLALEDVFPPFAPERNAALIIPTATVTLHARHLGNGNTGAGALLLPNQLANDLSLAQVLCWGKVTQEMRKFIPLLGQSVNTKNIHSEDDTIPDDGSFLPSAC